MATGAFFLLRDVCFRLPHSHARRPRSRFALFIDAPARRAVVAGGWSSKGGRGEGKKASDAISSRLALVHALRLDKVKERPVLALVTESGAKQGKASECGRALRHTLRRNADRTAESQKVSFDATFCPRSNTSLLRLPSSLSFSSEALPSPPRHAVHCLCSPPRCRLCCALVTLRTGQ